MCLFLKNLTTYNFLILLNNLLLEKKLPKKEFIFEHN